ncbi:uncharacterized protein LOC135432447 [Drosophila montana]|uniref:uncharacterized protein LOC135432447 n=1 Tax=Drosophila montana TaxID=40370 RepID=UPI00313D5009
MQEVFNLSLGLCLIASCCISFCHAALIYPTNSEYGLFVAISVPISLPHRNVFLSYNYEFNYYHPEHVYKFPPILMGEDFEDGYLTYPTHDATQSRQFREKRELSLMTRKTFYTILRDKLDRSGYPAEACLLRMICETNASALGEINGFLGNIVHVIFTPSSSRDEQLSPVYYQAEADGQQQQCSLYDSDCPYNVMDLISTPVERILQDIVQRRRRK